MIGGRRVPSRVAATLDHTLRAVCTAALLLLLTGCIPIGVRVQNMFAASLG